MRLSASRQRVAASQVTGSRATQLGSGRVSECWSAAHAWL